jgi:hypothetical protein
MIGINGQEKTCRQVITKHLLSYLVNNERPDAPMLAVLFYGKEINANGRIFVFFPKLIYEISINVWFDSLSHLHEIPVLIIERNSVTADGKERN